MDWRKPPATAMRHTPVFVVAAVCCLLVQLGSRGGSDALEPTAATLPVEPGEPTALVVDTITTELGRTAGRTPAPTGSAAPSAEGTTAPIAFAGRAFLGTYGALADAPVRVTVHAGVGRGWDDLGPAIAAVTVQSDGDGRFEGTVDAPRTGITLSAAPDLDDHRVFQDVRSVLQGEAGPRDLEPRAYRLDALVLGKVVDREGAPIAGARVVSHLSEVHTATDGDFALPLDSNYPAPSARVFADGYAVGSFSVGALRPGEQPGPVVELALEHRIVGHVVDAAGRPLAGASVSTGLRGSASTETDPDGRFELGGFDADAGRHRLGASLEGYLTATRSVKRDELATETGVSVLAEPLILRRGARITGRVLDTAGRPIEGAFVSRGGYPNTTGPGIAVTDADGAFELCGAIPGRQPVWARRAGLAADCVDVEVADEASADVEITLRPGHTIRGVVVEEGGEPVPYAEVRPEGSPTMGRSYVGDSGRTDAAGAFTLVDLPTGRASVRVFAAERADETHQIADGTRIVLAPNRTGRIAALVVDAGTGAPIDPFTVRLASPDRAQLRPGESALRGYDIAWLTTGITFWGTAGVLDTSREPLQCGAITALVVSAPGYAPCTVPRAVVTADAPSSDLVVRLERGVGLSGTVTSAENGTPIAGARVRWFAEGAPTTADPNRSEAAISATTDSHGRYELVGVAPGSVVLVLDETGCAPFHDGPFDVPPNAAAVRRDVAVPSGGSVRGRFTDEDGKAIPGATVLAYGPLGDGRAHVERRAVTNTAGMFAHDELEPGAYLLTGRAGDDHGGWSLTRLVEVPRTPALAFDLAPDGHGVVVGSITHAVEAGVVAPDSYYVQLQPESRQPSEYASHVVSVRVQDGRFRATGLRAGIWRVSFMLPLDGAYFAGHTTVVVPEEGEASATIAAVSGKL